MSEKEKKKLHKKFKINAKIFRNLAQQFKESYEKEEKIISKFPWLEKNRQHKGDLFQSQICFGLAEVCDNLAKLR